MSEKTIEKLFVVLYTVTFVIAEAALAWAVWNDAETDLVFMGVQSHLLVSAIVFRYVMKKRKNERNRRENRDK